MPRLYNLHHDYVVINHGEPGIPPGGPYDFTDEQVAAGLAGSWSETDPREGLADERKFKRRRDAKATKATQTDPDTTSEDSFSDENTDPAEPGENKETAL